MYEEIEKGGVMERKKWEGASEAGPATMTSRASVGWSYFLPFDFG